MNCIILIPSLIGALLTAIVIEKINSKKNSTYRGVQYYYGLDKMWHCTMCNDISFHSKFELKQYIKNNFN